MQSRLTVSRDRPARLASGLALFLMVFTIASCSTETGGRDQSEVVLDPSIPRARGVGEGLEMGDVTATIDEISPDWAGEARPGVKVGDDGYLIRYTVEVTGPDPVPRCELPVLWDDYSVLNNEFAAVQRDCSAVAPGEAFSLEAFSLLDLEAESHDLFYIVQTEEPRRFVSGIVTVDPDDIAR